MNDDDFDDLLRQLTGGQSTETSWDDVRVELEALARNLGDVLQAAWRGQNGDSTLARLQEMVFSATQQLSDTVDGTPEAQQARDQLVHLANSLNSAIERAGDQVRPELLRMLRQANAELRRRANPDDRTN
ncbi:MAG: hypothetical protein JO352_39855 [Chloroflexi bacterium]|nr:hypothetical protein [Chloroflexota bacterium]MBV9595525.1 hypothetical protein [Chloroflexota bacterium]